MSDDGFKGITKRLEILDTTLDLATLSKCVKSLLIKVLLAYTLLVRHSPPSLQYYELLMLPL